jgi:hypothetical protein
VKSILDMAVLRFNAYSRLQRELDEARTALEDRKVIDRAKFQPQLVGSDVTKDDVAFLGIDPGKEIDETWWDEMLVQWFDVPEEEKPAEEENGEAADSDPSSTITSKA